MCTGYSSAEMISINDSPVASPRKIKSEECFGKTDDSPNLGKDDMLECLQAIYAVNKKKNWNEKLLKLAYKVHKPGFEDKLRRRIERYIKCVPSPFSDGDEDGKEFRSKIPDNFIEHLKKLSRTHHHVDEKTSPMSILNHEANVWETDSMDALMSVLKHWLKTIPVKKTDFLGRPIRRDDLLELMVHRLEPLMRHPPTSKSNHKKLLTTYVKEILNEMPIDVVIEMRNDFLNMVCGNLVQKLLLMEDKSCKRQPFAMSSEEIRSYDYSTSTANNGSHFTVREIKEFVRNTVMLYLKKAGIKKSSRRLAVIEMEITGILVDAANDPNGVSNEVRKEVKDAFQGTGRLPEFQAKYCAEKLIKHFNEAFQIKSNESINVMNIADNAFSKSYYVFHNQIMQVNSSDQTESDKNIDLYREQVSKIIDEWLENFKSHIPLVQQHSFREMAVTELAEDVIERRMFLEMNPLFKDSDDVELERSQFNIYQWIRKLVGEDITETIENVPSLLTRIQSVPFPYLKDPSTKHGNNLIMTGDFKSSLNPLSVSDQVYDLVFTWCSALPDVHYYKEYLKDKTMYAKRLADKIKTIVANGHMADDAVDKEVCNWITSTLRVEPYRQQVKDIVAKVEHIVKENCRNEEVRNNVSMQVAATTSNIGNNTDDSYIPNTTDSSYQVDMFLQDVIKEVDAWLAQTTPTIKDCELRKIAIVDLAEDIVDRFKYVQLNPANRGSYFDELEHLKYQIFKWLNQLVGEDNVEVIEQAPHLMRKLRSISAPKLQEDENKTLTPSAATVGMEWNEVKKSPDQITAHPQHHSNFFKHQSNFPENSYSPYNSTKETENDRANTKQNPRSNSMNRSYESFEQTLSVPVRTDETQKDDDVVDIVTALGNKTEPIVTKHRRAWITANPNHSHPNDETVLYEDKAQIRLSNPSGFVAGPLACKISEVFQMQSDKNNVGKARTEARNSKKATKGRESKDADSFLEKATKVNNSSKLSRNSSVHKLPVRMTLSQTYEYFDKIFRDKVQELPIEESTEEQRYLGELARKSIINGIWKDIIILKSDPNVENDFSLFEQLFQKRLDRTLECLPQTPKLVSMSHTWKSSVASNVIEMIKYLNGIPQRSSFKEQLTENFENYFVKSSNDDKVQQIFVANTADAYILYSKYKSEDSSKANIYRQRLMKRLEELTEHVKRVHNTEFRYVDKQQLMQEAFRILANVPLPNDERLKEEADELAYLEEIEQWYIELPVKPIRSVLDDILRNRMREMLARKLHTLDKQTADAESLDRKIKHEVKVFLENNAELQENEDVNIDFMAEELANRLKTMRLQMPTFKASHKSEEDSSTAIPYPHPAVTFAPLISVSDGQCPLKNHQLPNYVQYPGSTLFQDGVYDEWDNQCSFPNVYFQPRPYRPRPDEYEDEVVCPCDQWK